MFYCGDSDGGAVGKCVWQLFLGGRWFVRVNGVSRVVDGGGGQSGTRSRPFRKRVPVCAPSAYLDKYYSTVHVCANNNNGVYARTQALWTRIRGELVVCDFVRSSSYYSLSQNFDDVEILTMQTGRGWSPVSSFHGSSATLSSSAGGVVEYEATSYGRR